ncbi:hypothetical protein C3420_02425 [Acinetobacter sp. ACNIH3]|uniref:hypothetical protein n=1 Tax=unclassified Acinetobacter TaxID=196816 RepID=UPI000CDCE85B|nr:MULTISPECIES: hypothetical protein [unclassified Acinetobacter]POU27085.1 hypothetical protein C3420_02425 [Acinetobacter sp. ACNIH3]POV78814.1 hypothetical protein C3421_05890 [Acinetobacter sp. ACNIH4]
MKKILIVLFIVAFAWMVKISYDLFSLRQAHTELSSSFTLLQQQNASLNDKVVALKRQVTEQRQDATAVSNSQIATAPESHDAELVRQQLSLIEFALQQQQYSTALEKLSQLQLDLPNYTLAPALLDGLERVLSKDQVMLQQFINSRLVQQNKIRDLLNQMDAEIAKELKVQHSATPAESGSFWRNLIQIEAVQQPSTVLMQRGLVLKEAQLRLLMAENVLQQSQQIPFQQSLGAVAEVLKQLPDAKSQQWVKQLEQIRTIPLTPVPPLNARTLMS